MAPPCVFCTRPRSASTRRSRRMLSSETPYCAASAATSTRPSSFSKRAMACWRSSAKRGGGGVDDGRADDAPDVDAPGDGVRDDDARAGVNLFGGRVVLFASRRLVQESAHPPISQQKQAPTGGGLSRRCSLPAAHHDHHFAVRDFRPSL